jgi:hypothetical protein
MNTAHAVKIPTYTYGRRRGTILCHIDQDTSADRLPAHSRRPEFVAAVDNTGNP